MRWLRGGQQRATRVDQRLDPIRILTPVLELEGFVAPTGQRITDLLLRGQDLVPTRGRRAGTRELALRGANGHLGGHPSAAAEGRAVDRAKRADRTLRRGPSVSGEWNSPSARRRPTRHGVPHTPSVPAAHRGNGQPRGKRRALRRRDREPWRERPVPVDMSRAARPPDGTSGSR